MGIFIKKIKCPKCKSTNYTKVNMEDENSGSGVLLNALISEAGLAWLAAHLLLREI